VIFEVLREVTINTTVFWDMILNSLVDRYQCLKEYAASIIKAEEKAGHEKMAQIYKERKRRD
jgi:hypothetical protein